MMKLSTAAAFFDQTVCTDAYNPSVKFKAQLDLFDDNKKEGLGASRRILSAAPSVVIPPRRTITFANQTWLVSAPYLDMHQGRVIRQKYSLQQCSGLARVQSFDDLLAGAAVVPSHTGKTLIKTGTEPDSAHLTNRFAFFFSPSDIVQPQDIISYGGRHFIVRSVIDVPTEFIQAIADELREPALEAASYAVQAYDPVTDVTVATLSSIALLRIRWELEFAYLTEASEKYRQGDLHGIVRSVDAPTIKAGDRFTLSDGVWVIQSVSSEGATCGLHLRRG